MASIYINVLSIMYICGYDISTTHLLDIKRQVEKKKKIQKERYTKYTKGNTWRQQPNIMRIFQVVQTNGSKSK